MPCVGDCVGKWQQCGGSGTDGVMECCDEGFFCYSLDNDFVDIASVAERTLLLVVG